MRCWQRCNVNSPPSIGVPPFVNMSSDKEQEPTCRSTLYYLIANQPNETTGQPGGLNAPGRLDGLAQGRRRHGSAAVCLLERRDVELDHLHHRVGDPLRTGRILVAHHLFEYCGHDLPPQSESIDEPAFPFAAFLASGRSVFAFVLGSGTFFAVVLPLQLSDALPDQRRHARLAVGPRRQRRRHRSLVGWRGQPCWARMAHDLRVNDGASGQPSATIGVMVEI